VNDVEALRRENEALLRELENAYAQLSAVLQVSQDETRIAYSELQEKLVVQEKNLVELSFLSSASEAFLGLGELAPMRRRVVEEICLLVPIDLVLLQLRRDAAIATQRERDLVREVVLDRPKLEALGALARGLDAEQRAVLLVPDLDAHPSGPALRLRPDARSAACLALRSGRSEVGLIVLNSRLRANFRDDQEPLLATFAHQAAAALAGVLRLEWHRDLLASLMAAHGLRPEALERCVRTTPPPGLAAEIRAVLAGLATRSDPTIGTPPRTEPEEKV
jgi:GAF domain-containing protein